MIVRTFRIDGNQRYSWIKNHRSWFVGRTRPCSLRLKTQLMSKHRAQLAPQNDQLMAELGIFGLKPDLRLEWRGQGGHHETQKPDHSASLGDSTTSSTRIRFSVHTAGRYRVGSRLGRSARARSHPRQLLGPHVGRRASQWRGAHIVDQGAPNSRRPSGLNQPKLICGAFPRKRHERIV